ncbi:MAG: TonB-dependent receptor [Citromicrobium sp.]|nr:MAG: TonB-dependent receptor [Citromicrobium sp.]
MLYHAKLLNCALPLLSLAAATAAHAQNGPPAASEEALRDDLHDRRVSSTGQPIVVTGTGLRELDVLAGTSVIEGAESRPVLRGFSGERVKVLIDGIGAIDVSNTSADHAVSVDPLTAERIEVLRGPAVLLYGSQAIGGAVNVIDKRIPLRRLNEPFHVDALLGADTASDLLEGGASIDAPVAEDFVFHIDGSWRRTRDLEIADYVLSEDLRAEVLANAAEEEEEGHLDEGAELRELAGQRGVLPNSATETWSANAGFAFFRGDSNLGASVGIYDTSYGVPMRPGAVHAHEHEEEPEDEHDHEEDHAHHEHGEAPVTIGLRQYRADIRGELALGDGFFSALTTRVGYSDYTHTEFEGAEVGTVFDVAGIEARAVLEQRERGGWLGSTGIQYYTRDFDAYGAEAYVPRNLTDQVSIFTLQEIALDPIQVEVAARYEATEVRSQPAGVERSFDTFSGALGLVYETPDDLRFGISGSRAERAPSAEELLSNGPHIATQAFEVGDPDLEVEGAWGVEAFLRGAIGDGTISLAAYRNWFEKYIYLAETGAFEDGLPVFHYLQADATYSGVEGQIVYPVYRSDALTLSADLRGDYVHAELDDGSALPRIPPLRLSGALDAEWHDFDLRGEVEWFARQDRIAAFETATDGFTQVNVSVGWTPWRGNENLTLMLQADNIFDSEGRRHASFTKDFVPLAGRNIKLSLRTSF